MKKLSEMRVKRIVKEEIDKFVESNTMTVKVKNLNHGTDENTDYIHQWETYMGHKATDCANLDCQNENKNPSLVGGHVIKSDGDDKSWYICPLCAKCNSDDNRDDMTIYEMDLAPYEDIKNL